MKFSIAAHFCARVTAHLPVLGLRLFRFASSVAALPAACRSATARRLGVPLAWSLLAVVLTGQPAHAASATTPAPAKTAAFVPSITPAPSAAQQQAQALAEVGALVAQGDLPGALARVQRATAAQPQDVQLRFVHGVLLMDLQRNEEALALFTLMSQQYPELPDPYNNLALLHVRAGQLQPALQALTTALRNDSNHRTARINLGQVYLLLAQQTWEQAAQQSPLDAAAQTKLEAVRGLLRGTAR
jgi:tetratricopeptide (TPR) repeat protein